MGDGIKNMIVEKSVFSKVELPDTINKLIVKQIEETTTVKGNEIKYWIFDNEELEGELYVGFQIYWHKEKNQISINTFPAIKTDDKTDNANYVVSENKSKKEFIKELFKEEIICVMEKLKKDVTGLNQFRILIVTGHLEIVGNEKDWY